VLGGASSGKSVLAEKFVTELDDELHCGVSYIATGLPQGSTYGDDEWLARVEAHQARRPSNWRTVELIDPSTLYDVLFDTEQIAMVDSVGSWLARLDNLDKVSERLGATLQARRWPTVLVSEEVGMSVHPTTSAGRRFQKILGELNQALADIAEHVFFTIAGRAIDLSVPNPAVQPSPDELDRLEHR
jgi:adenosyl cobinamide kinase/adenosyl cobinamide phosphate guanylyltransferase